MKQVGKLKKFYLTFGCSQKNTGKYRVIMAVDYDAARQVAHFLYGPEWCAIYSEMEWKLAGDITQAEKHGYEELK